MKARKSWISDKEPLSVSTQCELAGVTRSGYYGQSKSLMPNTEDLELMKLIDEEYTRHPFYGSRRMKRVLLAQGRKVNRKRVQRLMRNLGLAGIAPGPNTSKPHPQHKIYPYLLRGLVITRANHVWSTDVTYCRLPGGFMYLKGYETAVEMMRGLTEYFRFYNIERPHQSLGYKTPDEVYESATGGGARIVDKFSQKSASEGSSETTGQQQEAA